jgi:hypothetical protein
VSTNDSGSIRVKDVVKQLEPQKDKDDRDPNKTTFSQEGEKAQYSGVSGKRIQSLEDLIDFFHIDLLKWKIKRWECTSYESHTRMRRVDCSFTVKTGYARIDDEHKVVPLYRVWALLEENRPLILLDDVKGEILQEIRKFAPKYPKLPVVKTVPGSHLLEINLFDLHFGKLVWDQEAGDNYDVKIARELFMRCIAQMAQYAKTFPIDRVVFPVGNDFFNVDSEANTTTKGTPQDEDTRWKKTFILGRKLIIEAIDALSVIAPVDVPVIPGNHDATRAFYLGDALECWYHKSPRVTIDNSPKVRKYYGYGKCLIGLTHGKDEKLEDLVAIMAAEVPDLWAQTKYREWHLGDKHHQKVISWQSAREYKGVVVRIMRSLASTDAWHYKKGFVCNIRAGEGFIWHKEHGAICQFTATI